MNVYLRTFTMTTALMAAVAGGVILYRHRVGLPPQTERHQTSPEELRLEWSSSVNGVIREYTQDKNAIKARDQLLSLKVPAEKREEHLALVLALEAFIQQRNDAETRWQRAIVPFSGL